MFLEAAAAADLDEELVGDSDNDDEVDDLSNGFRVARLTLCPLLDAREARGRR